MSTAQDQIKKSYGNAQKNNAGMNGKLRLALGL